MSQPNQRAIELYYKKLKEAKVSNTASRSIVFAKLYESEHIPLTLSELVALTKGFVDRSSVYRSVELLEKIGIIRRLHIGWKYKLELSDDFHGHHHHITCTVCGKTHATHDDEEFEELLKNLAGRHGYQITDHQLDIRGVCSKCLKSTN